MIYEVFQVKYYFDSLQRSKLVLETLHKSLQSDITSYNSQISHRG